MKKNLFIAAMSLLVMAGCSSNEDEIDNIIANNDNAITFDTYVGKVTKAGTSIQQEFGVFGFYKEDGKTDPVAANFMYNQQVESNGSYSPIKYWPSTGTIDFIAYSPMASESNGIALTGNNATVGGPSITFTLPKDADTDLLASASTQRTPGAGVQLVLGHKLSKLQFSVTPPTAEGTTTTVTGIKLTGVNTVAIYNFASGWGAANTPKEFAASTTGTFYMIPQSVTDIKAVISYTVTVTDDSLASGFFTMTKTSEVSLKSDAASSWEANKQYNYTINPTASLEAVTISATVEEWNTTVVEPVVPKPAI